MFDDMATACGDADTGASPATLTTTVTGPVRLSERDPGPALVTVLARPPDRSASGAERLERIGALERVIGWLQTVQDAEMASFVTDAEAAMARLLTDRDPADGPPGPFDTVGHASRSATAEIQLMLHLTGAAMLRRLEHARRLHEPGHGPTTELARAGLLTPVKARKILDGTADLTDEQAARLQAAVLPAAPRQTVGQLRVAIDRFLTALADRELPARRRDRAIRSRSVELQAEPQGMATLRMFLPAAAAVGVYAVLDEHARRCGSSDPRTMDQRRTDVLTDLVLRETGWPGPRTGTAASRPGGAATTSGADPAGTEPGSTGPGSTGPGSTGPGSTVPSSAGPGSTGPGSTGPSSTGPAAAPSGRYDPVRNSVSVRINVTVPLEALLGRSEGPAELAGYGPLPVSDARALAFDPACVWYRLLTDPAGHVVHRDTTAYRPGAALAELVRARHGRCAHPGCRVPAHRCDLDHVVPHDPRTGAGPTSADNLHPLCRSHHVLKHLPGWRTVLMPDGTTEWTTPSGHVHRSEPEPAGSSARGPGGAGGPGPDGAGGRGRRGPGVLALLRDPGLAARLAQGTAEAPF
ncbi:hypothetical protein GCM10009613_29100 [Pseudonocardia kongjuensis]|uniref:DUF222 domain-containing protein n=1 Tax=Pseudonocardia kongjuensis TaxID=102227 RepID=A0ABN1XTQ9_9PSEU